MNQLKTLLIIPILSLFLFAFNTKTIIQSTQKQEFTQTEDRRGNATKTDSNLSERIIEKEEYIIIGKITNEKGNPLQEVIVMIEGSKHGFHSEALGQYAIKVPKGSVLLFLYKGMIPLKVKVTNDLPINVTLKKKPQLIKNIAKVPESDPNLTEQIIEIPIDNPYLTEKIIEVPAKDQTQIEQIIEIPIKNPNQSEQIIEVPVNQSKKPLIVIDGKISSLTIEDLDENNIYSMSVIKGKTAQDKYGDKGKDGVIEITTKKNETITVIGYKNDINKTVKIKSEDGKEPLIVIDGKVSAKKVDDLAPDDIQSINVLKGETAQDKYGDKGNDGVIEITLKKK